jgi:steroid delta-isomerase-like uncharacterized protein
MSAEENKALLRREYAEVYEARDFARFADFCAPGYVYRRGAGPALSTEALITGLTQLFAAFPDLEATIGDLVADDETVVCRWSFRGTHLGAYNGIAATGKTVTATGIAIYRVADGKYVETWEEVDMLGFLQQLGAVPLSTPGPA